MEDVLAILEDERRGGRPVALALVTGVRGHAPQAAGAKMLVRPDGTIAGTVGGGAFEARVIERALHALREISPPQAFSVDLLRELGMCCGGSMDVYLECFSAAERLVIFGGGHVARPLASMAASLGFRVLVVDERPEWANRERFPEAELHNAEFVDFLDRFDPAPTDYLVVVTRGHEHDQDVVERLLPRPFRYLGMIGSKAKVKKCVERLRARGFAEDRISLLHAPIGLPIGSETPEEIAVSICAELVAVRRGAERHDE